MNSYIAEQLEKVEAMEILGNIPLYYVEITLHNGEVYRDVYAELCTGGLGTRYGTQGIRLTRFGCPTFIPGEDIESIRWVRAKDGRDGDEEPEVKPIVPEPELTGVTR